MSGVTGNNDKRQIAATDERNENVIDSSETAVEIAIIVFLIGLAISLLMSKPGFGWLLIISGIIFWVGSTIKSSPVSKKMGYGPQIISAFGGIVLASAILSSGLIRWTVDTVDGWDKVASCDADPSQDECVVLRAEKQRLADLERQESRGNTSRRSATVVSYPIISQCGGPYTMTTNCEKVTFPKGAIYQREAKNKMCIAHDSKRVVTQRNLGGDKWAFSSSQEGATVHFHDISTGESFDGFKCG